MGYFLVRFKFADQIKDFVKNSYWENSSFDKYYNNVNEIKKGDILLLADNSYIKYFAKCKENKKDGKIIKVDKWIKFEEPIYFKAVGAYTRIISHIKKQTLIQELEEKINLQTDVDNFFIKSLKTDNFTNLKNGVINFNKINIFIGENGTGKSQVLKLLYAVLLANNEIYQRKETSEAEKQRIIANNLVDVMKPDKLGNLVNFEKKEAKIRVDFKNYKIGFKLKANSRKEVNKNNEEFNFKTTLKRTVFIPTKEILSFYKGFRILYEDQYLEFDKTYYELARVLERPLLKNSSLEDIQKKCEEILKGKVEIKDGRFYLIRNNNKLEMNLLAEGLRKIAMLSYLIANNSLNTNSILFWDEPESNMHPKLINDIVQFLVLLANHGMQIFISTHSPYILEAFNNHLKKFKIKDIDLNSFDLDNSTKNKIKNLEPLNPKDLKAYLLKENYLEDILDKETELIDDKLLSELNNLSIIYEYIRDIEWNEDE